VIRQELTALEVPRRRVLRQGVLVRTLVLAIAAGIVAPAAADVGWSVTPPAGWVEDRTAGRELRDRTREGFFAGVAVEVQGAVYHSPTREAVLAIQIVHGGAPDPEAVDRLAAQFEGTRVRRAEAGRAIVDVESVGDDEIARATVQSFAHEGVQHVITVVCREPRGGAACGPALASIAVGESPSATASGFDYRILFAAAGGALVLIALIGRRIDSRRRARR
jgi:hypothetical protein